MAWIEPNPETTPKNFKGPWYVRYRLGRRKLRSGPWWVKGEALDDLANRTKEERDEKRLRKGQYAEEAGTMTVLDRYLLEGVASGHMRQSTSDQKRRVLTPFLSRYPHIGLITFQECKNYVTELLTKPTVRSSKSADKFSEPGLIKTYSPTTASITLRALHTFLLWCVAQKIIVIDPMKGIKIPKGRKRRDVAKSKADLENIIAHAPNLRFRLFFTFLFFQGLRKGMIRQAEGTEFRNGMWTIPGFKAKVERDITVPVHPRTKAMLAECFPKGLPKGRIFEFDDNEIWKAWASAKAAAGITYPLTIHGARRTWATQFLTQTQNIKAMMEAGHWLDTKTALDYVHLSSHWLREHVDKFDYNGGSDEEEDKDRKN